MVRFHIKSYSFFSCAVRLIVEREREIHAFQTEAAYRITAVFLVPDTDGKLVEMKAELAPSGKFAGIC